MKIAIVSPYDFHYAGGVTKHITNLAESFRQQGHQVSIIAPSSQAVEKIPPDLIRISGFVVPVPYSGTVARIGFSPWLLQRVRALLQREAFDVVHLHEPMIPTLPWAGRYRGKRKEYPRKQRWWALFTLTVSHPLSPTATLVPSFAAC